MASFFVLKWPSSTTFAPPWCSGSWMCPKPLVARRNWSHTPWSQTQCLIRKGSSNIQIQLVAPMSAAPAATHLRSVVPPLKKLACLIGWLGCTHQTAGNVAFARKQVSSARHPYQLEPFHDVRLRICAALWNGAGLAAHTCNESRWIFCCNSAKVKFSLQPLLELLKLSHCDNICLNLPMWCFPGTFVQICDLSPPNPSQPILVLAGQDNQSVERRMIRMNSWAFQRPLLGRPCHNRNWWFISSDHLSACGFID